MEHLVVGALEGLELPLGVDEGVPLGTLLGKELGIIDGTNEGRIDILGTLLGTELGIIDGTRLGPELATTDGVNEGSKDGAVLGAALCIGAKLEEGLDVRVHDCI